MHPLLRETGSAIVWPPCDARWPLAFTASDGCYPGREVAGSIVMCFLSLPAEARSDALNAFADENAVSRFPGSVASAAASYVESERTQLEDRELILVSSQAEGVPNAALAEDFWRAVESTLFRAGVSRIEHMVAYAVPGEY